MDINAVHLKYEELGKAEIIKSEDTTNFSIIANEIDKIYEWENEHFHDQEYRKQLPEKAREQLVNEFNTAIERFKEIVHLRRSDDLGTLSQRKPGIINDIKNLYATLYNSFAQDYRAWRFLQENNSILETIKVNSQQVEKDLEKVKKQTEETVTNIVGAEATEEWAHEYSQYIFSDVSLEKEIKTIEKKQENNKKKAKGWSKYRKVIWYRLHKFYISELKGVVFYRGHSYFNSSRRWRFWRSIFFIFLIVIAIIYICYSLAFINNNPTYDSRVFFQFIVEKITFLPIVILAAIGMSFSSKNYRINANLLEDYKHRYLVAKTVQNILRLPNIKNDVRLQNDFLSSGTSVIFEHRPSGYSGKDSDENLLKTLISHMESFNIKAK